MLIRITCSCGETYDMEGFGPSGEHFGSDIDFCQECGVALHEDNRKLLLKAVVANIVPAFSPMEA